MSLHGQTHVQRNIILEKQRQRTMDHHLRLLDQIKGSDKPLRNAQHVTKQTDRAIQDNHIMHGVANHFNDNGKWPFIFYHFHSLENQININKGNHQLFMRLVDISKRKNQLKLEKYGDHTTIESGLRSARGNGKRVASTTKGYKQPGFNFNTADHNQIKNTQKFIKSPDEKEVNVTSSYQDLRGHIRTKHSSPAKTNHSVQFNSVQFSTAVGLHGIVRKEKARLVSIENQNIAMRLITIKGDAHVQKKQLEKEFEQQIRIKGLLCKLPIIDMSKNIFRTAGAEQRGYQQVQRGLPGRGTSS